MNLANAPFLEELYQEWQKDPVSVSDDWRAYFASLADSPAATEADTRTISSMEYKQSRVDSMLWAFRDVGFVYANINPLEYRTPDLDYLRISIGGVGRGLSPRAFGLSEEDMDREFSAGRYLKPARGPLREILASARETYCSSMGVEILHIQNSAIRRWLIEKIETNNNRPSWSTAQRRIFQEDLIRAEELEHFIQAQFVGQKRFSLEGGDVLIPALRYLLRAGANIGVEEFVFGMSHRGRLNVLTNVMRKPFVDVFAAFEDNYKAHTYGGSGDVKYHLGQSANYKTIDGHPMHVSLVANPSHLEAVDSVVEGKARGIQRRRADHHRKRVIPVLVHGDAAFRGQGVVSETFNLFQLPGYRTGGTVHIVVNNQIGFTTAGKDSRSTFFATDVAKTVPVPVFHVNGDDPEYVMRAIDLALQFRQKFSYDVVVDIFCYRRLGHNEADEPSFTHPLMYKAIKNHPNPAAIYGSQLDREGVFSLAEQEVFRTEYAGMLRGELQRARDGYTPAASDAFAEGLWTDFHSEYSHNPVETGVGEDCLAHVARTLTTIPAGFTLHPKLERVVASRATAFDSRDGIDWAFAESLAFGSLLVEGHPVRLSGEDCERGTFSQRHAIWWDSSTQVPRSYVPLNHGAEGQAEFSVYDSPLSEFSVLGFDYGYSLAQPNVLVMWEAQFGDFANGAQVIIDQFVAAGESKWERASGLVMLLPHGYEGQGPEHSSAHLERYLQLCAEDNMEVCYPTTPAQYFHLLRRQMKRPFRKPLIVMTPKSLLRHKLARSRVDQLEQGSYCEVIDDPAAPEKVDTVVLCSGKVYYDLAERRETLTTTHTALVRIEQLFPWPEERIREVLARYPDVVEIRWVQEESRNRGAWSFVHDRLRALTVTDDIGYVGRPDSASPATGSHNQHTAELERIVSGALAKPGGLSAGASRHSVIAKGT